MAAAISNTAGSLSLTLTGHERLVTAICGTALSDAPYLATVSYGGTARTRVPAEGIQRSTLTGHASPVNAICDYTLRGITSLAAASSGGSARIWDPAKGTSALVVPARGPSLTVAYDHGLLFIGTIFGDWRFGWTQNP
jgi:WD40 repeat protein